MANLSSAKSKITLWDELGEKVAPYLYNKDAGPYIVIVTTTTVKESCGQIVETVVMNPTFGTRRKGVDMNFLSSAMKDKLL
ncbi:hypothetical protein H5410_037677 [Solanum commersonii]|uniref:Uncharacterized protein n=1 Tax=Solanum commersonii TaxID=4109 RepID=A0A9J5Y8J7_SOLCO|nr:hypothetical protein H5410_037677 [Solanum commersonii]